MTLLVLLMHMVKIGLREACGEIGKAFEYFYRNDPSCDCSVKTKQEVKDETWWKKIQKMNTQAHSVHSETLPVDATETFLLK